MNTDDFVKYIKSICFEYNRPNYDYKQYSIFAYNRNYYFYNGSGWLFHNCDNLIPLKKIERSYKLAKILNRTQ